MECNKINSGEKVKSIDKLAGQATGSELNMFDEIYSTLHTLAKTPEDINLMSGI